MFPITWRLSSLSMTHSPRVIMAHSLYHTFVGIVDEDREEDLRQCIVCRYSEG